MIPESYPPEDADGKNVPRSVNEEQRQLVKQRIEEHAEKTKGKDIKRQSNAGLENTVYFLEHLNGRPVTTEQKMNNPNKERRAKQLFGSELQAIPSLISDPLNVNVKLLNGLNDNHQLIGDEPHEDKPVTQARSLARRRERVKTEDAQEEPQVAARPVRKRRANTMLVSSLWNA